MFYKPCEENIRVIVCSLRLMESVLSPCHTKLVKKLRSVIIKLTNQLHVTVLKTALRPLALVKLGGLVSLAMEEFFEVT